MIHRPSLPWRWFLGLAALLAALLLVVNLALRLTLPAYLRDTIRQDLTRSAWLAQGNFVGLLAASPTEINQRAHQLAGTTGLRTTILNATGNVIGESSAPVSELPKIGNHLTRPEVQQAMRDGIGWDKRYSATVKEEMLYVAVAVRTGDQLQGFVRVALPLVEVRRTVAHVERTIAFASLLVGLAMLPVVFVLSRRVSEPIAEMRQMATRVAAGDFSRRLPSLGHGELNDLGRALNAMATQLDGRLRELDKEKADLAAILAGMAEGVLVADAAGKIRLLNRTLRQLFELTDDALGKSVLAVFRKVELDQLLKEPGSREVVFLTPVERVFTVNAAALSGQAGTVIVFHDITRLKQLESLRKDFVANVSHELRTPLSIIKGYIETLLEEQPTDPATARQFLGVAQKHTRQLEALVEDLLSISALESQQARLSFGSVDLRELASTVAEELAGQARDKQMTVGMALPADLPAVRADRQRLSQVLTNLLQNAIKYTQPAGQINMTGRVVGNEVEFCVADNGPGIAAEHLLRVFERFYRVDKARSRELGGTGLGLSIVKHIVQAHGGRVWAESVVGQGSKFYFALPKT